MQIKATFRHCVILCITCKNLNAHCIFGAFAYRPACFLSTLRPGWLYADENAVWDQCLLSAVVTGRPSCPRRGVTTIIWRRANGGGLAPVCEWAEIVLCPRATRYINATPTVRPRLVEPDCRIKCLAGRNSILTTLGSYILFRIYSLALVGDVYSGFLKFKKFFRAFSRFTAGTWLWSWWIASCDIFRRLATDRLTNNQHDSRIKHGK